MIVGWVAIAGIASLGFAVWALQSNPWLALAIAVLLVALVVYCWERGIRYAEKNPIPALMGGAELLKVIEGQYGAKDKSIVQDDNRPTQIGGIQPKLENRPTNDGEGR